MKSVTAKCYCSSANLSSGFDLVAICSDAYSDRVKLRSEADGLGKITVVSKGLPEDPERNSASIPVSAIMRDYGIKDSLTVEVIKGIPVSSGLGGSGASAAASTVAMNELYSLGMTMEEMVRYSSAGESASGSVHMDNVAASIFGYFTVITDRSRPSLRSYRPSLDIKIKLVVPDVKLKKNTSQMRKILPETVSLSELVDEKASYSALIAGMITGDRELLRMGMECSLVEKVRYDFYSYAREIHDAGLEYNAIGVSLSGSGPSLLIIFDSSTDIPSLNRAIESIMNRHGIPFHMKDAILCGGCRVEG